MALMSFLGVAAMIWFAFLSIRAALGRGAQPVDAVGDGGEPFLACLRRVARVAVVSPLLYVEFLLIPAGAAGTFKEPLLRLEFTFGLIGMAALTCYGYAAGGGRAPAFSGAERPCKCSISHAAAC